MTRLAGKVAWVSGAASGIGESTARLFAFEGASIVIADTCLERAERLADEIIAQGGRALAVACDVSHEDQVRAGIERTVECFGALNILVNCAGIVHIKRLHEYSEDEWDQLNGVNVKSIFLAVKHGLPHLTKNKRSYVVNVGSISSFVGQAGTPAYTTSKHAILGLTRSIALDYAELGLRCNCVCPGITDTPLLREHLDASGDPEGMLRERLQRVPTAVALSPHDVAKSILFFSCEDSSGVTGTSLVIDGGYLAAAEWHSPEHTAFMENEG